MINTDDRVAPACARSAREHERLCPRQVLGVRMGYAAVDALQLGDGTVAGKRLLIITETDGCFIDGISAATGCTMGHRTLRLVDYGRVALTAIDTLRGAAIRAAPRRGAREAAWRYASEAPHRYSAQLAGYQSMPIDELLTVQSVALSLDLEALLGNGAHRVDCARCGEEILNGRGALTESGTVCPACRTEAYYATGQATSWPQ